MMIVLAVAMARPGYPCYRNVLTALGCEVVEIGTGEETRFQPTVEQLDALVAAAASALVMARWLRARLGGYTGDTLGAAQQGSEMAVYLALRVWDDDPEEDAPTLGDYALRLTVWDAGGSAAASGSASASATSARWTTTRSTSTGMSSRSPAPMAARCPGPDRKSVV